MCWLRWLMWMWFDFSLKLSTHSIRFNSSLRSFISFSETKKKLQSLHWERKRSRRSRWWRRSWRSSTDTSQLFHTQSKTWRRWWKTMTSAFYRSDFRSWMIDWLIDDWLIDDELCVCSAEVSSLNGKVSDLLVSLVSASEVKATAVLILNVLSESGSHHSRIHRCLLELWLMRHVTWATCPSESGRRCRTLFKTVSLEKIKITEQVKQCKSKETWGSICDSSDWNTEPQI